MHDLQSKEIETHAREQIRAGTMRSKEVYSFLMYCWPQVSFQSLSLKCLTWWMLWVYLKGIVIR